jgi:hypothetical protein
LSARHPELRLLEVGPDEPTQFDDEQIRAATRKAFEDRAVGRRLGSASRVAAPSSDLRPANPTLVWVARMTKWRTPTGVGKSASDVEALQRGCAMTHPDDRSDSQSAHAGSSARNDPQRWLKDATQPGPAYDDTWGAYHHAFFPPRKVNAGGSYKRMSTGVNVVRRYWHQREELRHAYEAEHGEDPDRWPHRHPAIVIDAVESLAYAACLGCQWIDTRGTSMKEPGWREAAAVIARRHEAADVGDGLGRASR